MELSLLQEEALNIRLPMEAIKLRERVLQVVEKAGRGHIGPALSIIEIVTAVYRIIATKRKFSNSHSLPDRFVLSKGHGCLGLYVVLESLGLLGELELMEFCSYDSAFGGHPESATVPAIEFSTGSLGHGLPVAVGMAKAAKIKNENWNVYVLVGDGELNEGSTWEAAAHAKKHKLDNLKVVVDLNGMQASGSAVEVLDMSSIREKWEAFGFETCEINGHDLDVLELVLSSTSSSGVPQCIIAHTIKGKGIIPAENNSEWHHKAKISKGEIDFLRAGLQK
jgi:transketolase